MEPSPALKKLSAARPPKWTWAGTDCVHALAWAPHGHTLAVATLAGELAILDGATGKPRWTVADAHPNGALWVAWHPAGALLASGGQDGAAKLWDANTGKPVATLFSDRKKWTEHGGWTADGSALAVAAGKDVTFWDAAGKSLGALPTQKATVAALAWHPKQPELLIAGFGLLSAWKVGQEKPVASKEWPTAMLCAAWKPESWEAEWAAAGTADASIEIWKVGSDETFRMSGYPAKIREIAWHADGNHLSTGGGMNIVCWDFRGAGPEGSTPQEWIAHSEPVCALAAHPTDPTRVASSGRDQLVFIWKLGSDDPATMRAVPESVPSLLAWKPDGSILAAGCEGGEVVAFAVG